MKLIEVNCEKQKKRNRKTVDKSDLLGKYDRQQQQQQQQLGLPFSALA